MTNSKTEAVVVFTLADVPDLVRRLFDALGEPVDSYWNGSHTWFGTIDDVEVEWRLHPVSAFKMPEASRPEELFMLAVENEVDATHYWDGLEVFAIDDFKEIELDEIKTHAETTLGIKASASGHVDHDAIGDAFESTQGKISIVQNLLDQIGQ